MDKMNSTQWTEEEMKIRNEIEEQLSELIEDIEDNYGIVIDCTFSWDYYKEE